MEKKRLSGVILSCLLVIAIGVWVLFKYAVRTFSIFFNFNETKNTIELLWVIVTILYTYILPLSFIVGGVSCLGLKEWGRRLTVLSLLIALLIKLYGIITYWYFSFLMKDYVPIFSQKGRANVEMITISMLPNYVIVFFVLIVLIYLNRPNIKERFK